MNEYFNYLNGIIGTYWNQSGYLWLFCIAILGIFFLENNHSNRLLLLWYPLVVYGLMVSPIGVFVGDKIWGDSLIVYYCRQFSLIPFFGVIAYAGTLLANKFKGYTKLIVVVVLLVVSIVFGAPIIYFHDVYGFEKSENAYKIPTDLITICDYMDSQDDDPVVVLNTNLSYMARQYDPSLHLLVGARDYENVVSNELASPNPNVDLIMRNSCEAGGDYVIADNSESVKEAFLERGYSPSLETKRYLLYECKGFPGVEFTFNDKELIVRRDYYDEQGNRCMTPDGFATVTYAYDESGRVIEVKLFDENGNPIDGEE